MSYVGGGVKMRGRGPRVCGNQVDYTGCIGGWCKGIRGVGVLGGLEGWMCWCGGMLEGER
ncbi:MULTISPECIES: hypothetical protein [Bartonella]|uniref:hypothetical protein n=1 Tax=Bartonella TaxID=773 RepID=UPI0009993F4B|nr:MULTISPECIES: hypothetical protein [Bartonella]